MKRHRLLVTISANLLVLLALAFIYPHLMISPGPLMNGHAQLSTDCFSCHSPWRGAAAERCISCHALKDIGLRTTKGTRIEQKSVKVSFHQDLIETDCMACHSDHTQPKFTKSNRKPFSHSLLRITSRDQCASCHSSPQDNVHRTVTVSCGQCHTQRSWTPANFDHASLARAVLDHCESCHTTPADSLHRQVKGNCKQCHNQTQWKPATFDHDKFFALDRDHNATCATCHTSEDYSRYTCYGCHEHTPGNIRAEHEEEGIRNFENCVKCHRSANGEPEGGGSREGRERD